MSQAWNRLVLAATVGLCRTLRPLRSPRPLPDSADWRRIVLVQNTGLGDALLSSPAIRAVRLSFPEAHLAVIGHQRQAGLLALSPHIDQLMIYRGKAKSFRPLLRELRAGRFEVGVVLHGNDPETIPLLWAGRVGCLVADAKTRLAFLLSRTLPSIQPGQHMVDHRLDLVRAIGARPRDRRLEQTLDQESLDLARKQLDDHLPGEGPLVALAPGGSAAFKRWPAERFGRVGRFLQDRYGARILILTGPGETGLAETLARELKPAHWASQGRVDLVGVAGLLALSRLCLSNDSGLFHLALALGRPTLGIMGAEGPSSYGPVEAERAETVFIRPRVCAREPCLRKNCPDPVCLTAIDETAVQELIEARFGDLLAPSGPGGPGKGLA